MTGLRASGLSALTLSLGMAAGADAQLPPIINVGGPTPWQAQVRPLGAANGGQLRLKTLADLKKLSPAQLKEVFAMSMPGSQPVGLTRGEVLYLAEALPLAKITATRVIWRGKFFDEQGTFVNQWTGFRAIHSSTAYGPSRFDGRPCMILEYPSYIPFFGNMRDEIREVCPGLYLSMVFECSAPYKFRGIIGLELLPPERAPLWPLQ